MISPIDWWNGLSYPVKGAIIRSVRAGLALVVGTVLALLTAGLLPISSPALVLIFTMILQGLDKYLREAANTDPEPDPNPEPDGEG